MQLIRFGADRAEAFAGPLHPREFTIIFRYLITSRPSVDSDVPGMPLPAIRQP
jgi:hypothetical protein